MRRLLLSLLMLAGACAGPEDLPDPPAAPLLGVQVEPQILRFSWSEVENATSYRLLLDPNGEGAGGFEPVAVGLGGVTFDYVVSVHRHDWERARFVLEACNAGGCSASQEVGTPDAMLAAIGYVKASNASATHFFGTSLDLSADGRLLAVGSPNDGSGVGGVDGDPSDTSAPGSGAVHVYALGDAGWAHAAYLKASTPRANAAFGQAVAVSADGRTLVVGAPHESSAATGVNGDESDASAPSAGAAYVFVRVGASWAQQAYLKASNTDPFDRFGAAVAISADGDRLAVGAFLEDSAATGVDGDESDDSAGSSGAVYVFTRVAGVWVQEAYLKASNTRAGHEFGRAMALSDDGRTLAVGAPREDSPATGVNGDEDAAGAFQAGAVYVFVLGASGWQQQAYVKASNTGAGDEFGAAVAVSGDGELMAVGAPAEASATTGIDGDQGDDSAIGAGAVYVFGRAGGDWTQQAYVKASNTETDDGFGGSVALSRDGTALAVGGKYERSAASGVGGDQADNAAFDAGAAYTFRSLAGTWSQEAYVKASNTREDIYFGTALALDGDGGTLAVGAPDESGAATGVGGDQDDQSADGAGAVYLY
jgi:trimeric autotransporter adhesin